jgi:hypothetical protein
MPTVSLAQLLSQPSETYATGRISPNRASGVRADRSAIQSRVILFSDRAAKDGGNTACGRRCQLRGLELALAGYSLGGLPSQGGIYLGFAHAAPVELGPSA